MERADQRKDIVKVLLFPAAIEKPVFGWLDCNGNVFGLDGRLRLNMRTRGPDVVIPPYPPHIIHRYRLHVSVEGRLFFKHPNARFNKSISMLLKGLGRSWYGDVVFWLSTEFNGQRVVPANFEIQYLRQIVDFIQMSPYNGCVIDVDRFPWQTMPGLRIACDARASESRMRIDTSTSVEYIREESMIEPVVVPAETRFRQYPCGRAQYLGLHWFIREDSNCLDWVDDKAHPDANIFTNDEVKSFLANREARHLANFLRLTTCRREQQPVTDSGLVFRTHPGTIIVVNAWGEHLHPLHIIAFNKFWEDEMNEASAENFQDFWEVFKENCKRRGHEAAIANLRSPHELETNHLGQPMTLVERLGN